MTKTFCRGIFLIFITSSVLWAAGSSPPSPDPAMAQKGWLPLLQRLQADKIYNTDVGNWFAQLPENFSPSPMTTKISSLFRARFIPPHFAGFRRPPDPLLCYPGVVIPENIAQCRIFMRKHAEILQQVEKLYGVPGEILTALLLVETRLGTVTGRDTALWTLACMAAANEPARLRSHLGHLPVTREREPWLRDQVRSKSEWAYAELKALIAYCRQYKMTPLEIKGSVSGAIGLCQFMPSNINFYAVDGDEDGRIDLASLPDALFSAANFLKKHGWRSEAGREARVKVLRRYNHSLAYANTILALAENLTVEDAHAPTPSGPTTAVPPGS